MNSLAEEYWDKAALDPEVDKKYICDVDTELCLQDLGELKGKVLEIGCGVGRLLKDDWFGVDTSLEMIKLAAVRTKATVALIFNGVLPFEDYSFDNVFTYLLFQHLKPKEVENYVQEAYRVLKKGEFVFQFIEGKEREPLSNHYSKEEMTSILKNAGFKKIVFKESVAHELWTMCRATK